MFNIVGTQGGVNSAMDKSSHTRSDCLCVISKMGVMQKAQLQEQVLAGAVMCLTVTGSTPTAFSHGDNAKPLADEI